MRINHNISSMFTQSALYQIDQNLSTSLERLSTGLRINSASDDPAGLAISENLRSQVNGTSQAQKNAQDGVSALNVADGAANEISSILQRMRELAVQSSNDTLNSTDRVYADQEFGSLRQEIDRIANTTIYNNRQLISATAGRFGAYNAATGNNLWIGPNGTLGIDNITISISTLTSSAISANLPTDSLTSEASASSAISDLDTAISSVNSVRASIGAYVNRLGHAINNLMVGETNQQAAESLIRDVDFASETSTYTKNQILQQSAYAMLSQANMLPSTVLSLLK